MLNRFSIEDISPMIKNEDYLISFFEYLINEGLNLSDAYNFITELYGEEEISKFLNVE